MHSQWRTFCIQGCDDVMVGIGKGEWLTKALCRLFCHGSGHKAIELRGSVPQLRTEQGDRCLEVLLHHFFITVAGEDALACEQVI